jgi:hypothetical protein
MCLLPEETAEGAGSILMKIGFVGETVFVDLGG